MKRGGDFIAEGGFTCVYSPPLTCRGQPDLPAGKYVSRVVNDPSEIEIQKKVKEILARLETKYPGKVAKYFNLMVSACDEFTIKPTDIHPNKHGEVCNKSPKLQTPGEIKKGDGLYNLITPRQRETLGVYHTYDKPPVLSVSRNKTLKALKPLLEALVYVRGEFIHHDAHMGNIGWMLDDRLVLFDWGSVTFGVTEEFKKSIASFKEVYDRDIEYGETDVNFRTSIVVFGTEDPERLSVIWDLVSILNQMKYLPLVRRTVLNKARDKIIDLLKVGVPSQDDLLKIINELFQNPIGGTRRRRLRRKTTRK